ncbi:DUF262 domain-containing HNH endonuclease family protein [Campylobacter sp.]|uniref:DUF262 domain-containing protein n=1 Tax=Campylobacter sp. TaxID=205 RepID=UPI002AA80D07|nr:DUF262 domain-containing HNH endonuclease family protein [Campylobacter sp.]MCI7446479.1 DUF262 domain-containing HNH endonuclease family protein [Campylobacter sp.]
MQTKVSDVFSSNNLFSIPNYQRDYAWGAHNITELWEDLEEAKAVSEDENNSNEMGHFLGTIVLAKRDDGVYDIIDGQQRATTIYLLRYALNAKKNKPERNINIFLDDDDKPRLQVTDQNSDFFAKLLKQADNKKIDDSLDEEAITSGQKNLYEVFKEIWAKIGNFTHEEASSYLSVLDNMVLMRLEEKNAGRAIRMFQTVNDRGVPLSLLDKLKALLILYSNKFCNEELDDKINKIFGDIFKISMKIKDHRAASSLADTQFVSEVENRIFRYHLFSNNKFNFTHYRDGADELYKNLKNELKNMDKSSIKDWIDFYIDDFSKFFKSFYEILELSLKNPNMFKLLFILRINPYFYAPLVRLKMNNLLDDECLELFGMAEIIFYNFGSTLDATAYHLQDSVDSKENFKNTIIKNVISSKVDVEYHLNQIERYNFDWKKCFHYLFLTYREKNISIDNLMKILGDSKTYSMQIEHIISQNTEKTLDYEKYGFDDLDDFETYKNSFGNLIPLEGSINSSINDKSLAHKQDEYKKSAIFYNQCFANSPEFLNFSKETIIEENQKFKEWAKDYFSMFLPKQ